MINLHTGYFVIFLFLMNLINITILYVFSYVKTEDNMSSVFNIDFPLNDIELLELDSKL